MKKLNKPWAVAATFAALLFISMIYTTKYASLVDEQRAAIKRLDYKVEAQKKALELSDDIMDNNELWDCDGSDLMSDYLHLRSEIDKDFMKGFHGNLAFTCNE